MTPLDNAGSVTWALGSGPSLPAGLSVSSAGVISGTPTTPGFYNFNVTGNDTVDTVFRSVSINVYAVSITTAGDAAERHSRCGVHHHHHRGGRRRGGTRLQRNAVCLTG